MAKDDDRPQFNPKHRIAGAIILVSLAVIFIPMLLDESAPPSENQTLTQIPSRDAQPAETKVVVTPVAPAAEQSPVAEPPKVTQTAPAEPQPGKPSEKPASTAAPKADVARTDTTPAPVDAPEKKNNAIATTKPAAAKPSDVAEKVSRGWLVQVGTFANADNADRLRDKLKDLGYTVNAETITVQRSKAVRLRVGPYREKSAAIKAQAQLQKELNIKGIVLAYP